MAYTRSSKPGSGGRIARAVRERYGIPQGLPGPLGDAGDGLGDIVDSAVNVIQYASKLPQYAATIAEVIDDPYLPEVACRIDQIYDARKGYPIKVCSKSNVPSTASTLFGRAMPVIRGVAYAESHKWVYPAFFAVLFGVPMAVGYALGRSK